MNVNSTLDLIELHAKHPKTENPDRLLLLREDIIQSVKFDLGDEFSEMPGFELKESRIPVPKLPYDKVYFEAVSFDGKRYGALLENYEDHGVCGQVLVEAAAEGYGLRGLFPIGILFTQAGDELAIHRSEKGEEFKDMEIGAIVALDLMVKAIAVMNCSNVTLVDSPEKKLINEKRKKKKKLPLYTFKTLHIDTGAREKRDGKGYGTHASPRVHLRRGHIRKLADGRTIWVQPCVVGDKSKGIVHKDYSVRS